MTVEDEDFELLDAGASSSRVNDSEVHRSTGSRSTVLLVAALVAVALLVWGLTRPDDTSNGENAEPDEAVIEQGVGDTPSTTLITPTTNVPTSGPSTLVPGVALLGEPTGLWLFYGGEDPLQRLDLDTGEVSVFGLRTYPIAARSGELILTHNGSGAVGWVGLDDPGEQAERWKEGRVAFDHRSGLLWTLEGGTWLLHDLTTRLIVEQRPAEAAVPLAAAAVGRPAVVVPNPEIISTASGIYLSDGSSSRRVATSGDLLVFDLERALVRQCGDVLDDCSLAWFDRASWAPLDLPLPDSQVTFAEFLGGGQWLHSIGPDGFHHLLALPADDQSGTDTGQAFDIDADSLSVSADGRWLVASRKGDAVEFYDLAARRAVRRFDGLSNDEGGTVLLVDKP